MKKIIFPLITLSIIVSALTVVTTISQDRRTARDESILLAQRLSRAEAAAKAAMKVDDLYWEAKVENAALRERLATAEASSLNRTELKDAVADRPKPRSLPLPGYAR